MSVPPVVPWVIGFAGVGLLYSAVRNVSPLDQLRAVLTGGPGAGPIDYPSSVAVPYSPTDGEPPASGSLFAVTPTLVTIRNFKLTPTAAAGFSAWEKAFGEQIPVTSGWRSYASQLAEYNADPDRFAHPGKSRHVKGDAVDVDNNWLSALPANKQSRLRVAARAAGWRQPRYDKGEAGCGASAKTNDEPWHFSFLVCG
jgi:hypothetical protein